MKPLFNKFKRTLCTLAFVLIAGSSWAEAGESIKWVGVIQEEGGFHSPKHDRPHSLEFVRRDDNETFDIVDSPNLVKAHQEQDKKLLVEIEGERTSRFLFWGDNLIVKNFKILEEMDGISHAEPVRKNASIRMNAGDRK